jgi:hypothetical protein
MIDSLVLVLCHTKTCKLSNIDRTIYCVRWLLTEIWILLCSCLGTAFTWEERAIVRSTQSKAIKCYFYYQIDGIHPHISTQMKYLKILTLKKSQGNTYVNLALAPNLLVWYINVLFWLVILIPEYCTCHSTFSSVECMTVCVYLLFNRFSLLHQWSWHNCQTKTIRGRNQLYCKANV